MHWFLHLTWFYTALKKFTWFDTYTECKSQKKTIYTHNTGLHPQGYNLQIMRGPREHAFHHAEVKAQILLAFSVA
jgi:hypothetical protein